MAAFNGFVQSMGCCWIGLLLDFVGLVFGQQPPAAAQQWGKAVRGRPRGVDRDEDLVLDLVQAFAPSQSMDGLRLNPCPSPGSSLLSGGNWGQQYVQKVQQRMSWISGGALSGHFSVSNSYGGCHTTCAMQHAPCNMRHATCAMQHGTCPSVDAPLYGAMARRASRG